MLKLDAKMLKIFPPSSAGLHSSATTPELSFSFLELQYCAENLYITK